jgi:hypothetical protein
LLVASLGLASGCGVSAAYVPTAGTARPMTPRSVDEVEVFLTQKPDRPFKDVGMIEVQQEILNDSGTSALVGEIRRVAAQRGCDGVVISGANDAVVATGYMQNGSGNFGARTLKGYRATCIVFDQVPLSEPPRGAAGFTFGADVATAQAACAGASFPWTATAPGQFTCGGVLADVGLRATSALRFCEGRLCGVELRAQPKGSRASEWREELRALRRRLEQKYGRPTNQDGSEPPDCSEPGDERCAATGRTAHAIHWKWGSGERIDLVLSVVGIQSGEVVIRTPEIVLDYRKEASTRPAREAGRDGL